MSLRSLVIEGFVVTVSPMTSVREAARIMYENGVGSVLVVGEDGRLQGIFTERDLVRVIATNKDLNKPVKEFMTKNVETLKPNDSMWKALEIMINLGIRHIPILDDNGRPIGVVGMRDLINRLRETDL